MGAATGQRLSGWHTTAGPELGPAVSSVNLAAPLATFVVNTTDDENTLCNAAGCSLREAIEAAAPGDEITFSSLFDSPRTITLQHGEILIEKNLTITGPGALLLTVSGNNQSRVLRVRGGFTVNISGLIIAGGNGVSNTFPGLGGGILNSGNLTLTRIRINGNTGGSGGAIFNGAGAVLRVIESQLSGNTATNRGGGISTNSNLTVLRSTIFNNTAQGGITGGGIDASGTLNVINSTISSNRVTNGIGPNGGGILVFGTNSTATIVNATITQNLVSDPSSAGGLRVSGGTVSLLNTIVAGNQPPPPPAEAKASAPDATVEFASIDNNDQAAPDVGGPLDSLGHNLFGDGGTATGFANSDKVGNATAKFIAKLQSLLNNGGPTDTHALDKDSEAVNGGNNCVKDQSCPLPLSEALTTDQRLSERLVDGKVDMGAYELGAEPAEAPSLTITDVTGPESSVNVQQNTFPFEVRLSAPSDKTVTVNAITFPGTASEISDYEAQALTLSFNPGQTSQTFTVVIVNDEEVELDETFSVRLSDASLATIADGEGVGTITNDDLPSISMAIQGTGFKGPNLMGEHGQLATFFISLSRPSPVRVTVFFSLEDGTARAAEGDYQDGEGVVIFDPGETRTEGLLAVGDDDKDEADETFTVNLSNPTNATLKDRQKVVTIIDNDGPNIVGQNFLRVNEGSSGSANAAVSAKSTGNAVVSAPNPGSTAAVVVNLEKASVQDITVDFATGDGTATAGSDYTAASGSLTIPAGATSGTISVPILDDTTSEPDETFFVNLSNPVNGFFANAQTTVQVTVTILDDDVAPQPSPLLLSQFRENGPNGATDEFVEIFNPADSAHTVTGANGTGYGVFASAGNGNTSDTVKLVCVIPEGTMIPAFGYFLCTGTSYSLGNLGINGGAAALTGAGGTVPNVSANMSAGAVDGGAVNIPDDAGLALISVGTNIVTNSGAGFAAAGIGSITVFDRVGFAAYGPAAPGGSGRPPNADNFCETTCLQPIGDAANNATCAATGPNFPGTTLGGVCYGQSGQYTILRRQLFTTLANFRAFGTVGQDTDNSADDFLLLSPNPSLNTGMSVTDVAGVNSIQGAASPHNGSAPSDAGTLGQSPFDSSVGQVVGPNAERIFSAEDPVSGPAGTFTLRLKYTNIGTRNLATPTGANVVGGVGGGLRFRLDILSTLCGQARDSETTSSTPATANARNLRSSDTCQEGSNQFSAVLKAVSSTGEMLQDTSGTMRTVRGTVLEDVVVGGSTPTGLSPLGGGINNSLVVTAASPGATAGTFSPGVISPGDVIFVKFKFGIQTPGRFIVLITPEASSAPTPTP